MNNACVHTLLAVHSYSGQPFTKWQDFKGGIYWEDLLESIVSDISRVAKFIEKYKKGTLFGDWTPGPLFHFLLTSAKLYKRMYCTL